MNQHDEDQALYARLLPRFQALVVDLAAYLAATVLFVLLGSAVPYDAVASLMVYSWIGVLLLYEPIMVWRFGGTLGHMWRNLQVVSNRTDGRPPLIDAFIRWLVKSVAGVLSFFFMALTKRHQALHDIASATTVQARNTGAARRQDFATARSEPTGAVDVSVARRLVAILVYQVAAFVLISVASTFAVSEACLFDDLCTSAEDVVGSALGLAWMALAGAILVLGWKGRLVGARRSAT